MTDSLKENGTKTFDTGRVTNKFQNVFFLLTAHKHPSQSLYYNMIFFKKVELHGHFLRKINLGCMKRGTGI